MSRRTRCGRVLGHWICTGALGDTITTGYNERESINTDNTKQDSPAALVLAYYAQNQWHSILIRRWPQFVLFEAGQWQAVRGRAGRAPIARAAHVPPSQHCAAHL